MGEVAAICVRTPWTKAQKRACTLRRSHARTLARTIAGCANPFRPLCRKSVCVQLSCKDAFPQYAAHGFYAACCIDALCSHLHACSCNLDSTAGLRARLLCPETCGCNLPNSSLVFSGPADGCGPGCIGVPVYRQALAALPCRDAEPNSTELKAYTEPLMTLLNLQGKFMISSWVRDFLLHGGCQAWVSRMTRKPQTGPGTESDCILKNHEIKKACGGARVGPLGLGIRPLTFLCPVACGCNSACRTNDDTCPKSC